MLSGGGEEALKFFVEPSEIHAQFCKFELSAVSEIVQLAMTHSSASSPSTTPPHVGLLFSLYVQYWVVVRAADSLFTGSINRNGHGL